MQCTQPSVFHHYILSFYANGVYWDNFIIITEYYLKKLGIEHNGLKDLIVVLLLIVKDVNKTRLFRKVFFLDITAYY